MIITMTDRQTNLSENHYRGTRCRICTGCGRCAEIDIDLDRQSGVYAGTGASGSMRRLDVVTADLTETKEPVMPWADQTPGAEPESASIVSVRGERLVAADLGTTTIAMQLLGEDGRVEADYVCVNPQVRYGADVLSRIQAARDAETAREMRRLVTEELAKGLAEFQSRIKADESLKMVLAGNTTMIYLLMGYDPEELGHAPFHATHLEPAETRIAGVPCGIFPGLSAFVGGDITAGMYACGLREREEITLLIDLGTNGEMVLGNRKRSIACATAAGPAFEGGVNRGIWGADMVHLLAKLREEELLDDTGLLAEPYFEDGVLIGSVRVTQQAVRAIQLAKGAIGAGIRILMKEYGIDGDFGRIDRVILAGGFGYYLRPQDAAMIGLLPEKLVPVTSAGGNTALAGAMKMGGKWLADSEQDCSWARLFEKTSGRSTRADISGAKEAEIMNLAQHPDFEELYLENMDLKPNV